MATITQRGPWTFEVQVRRKGYPQQTKRFSTYEEADAWGKETEADMIRGTFVSRKEAERTTIKDALERYRREITPTKKGAKRENDRILALQRHPIAAQSLAALTGARIATYRDERLEQVGPSSVQKEIAILSHLYTIASKEWGLPLDNPARNVRLPQQNEGRDRRLWPGEEERLLEAAADNPTMKAWIIVALETAMRRGEMARARRDWIRGRVIRIPDTKASKRNQVVARNVPLSTRAREAIATLPANITGSLFGIKPDKATRDFEAIRKKAGSEDIHLHDLRHEATSRLFEAGLDISEVASITGHQTWAMLKRYTHHTAERLADKLG